MAAGALKWGESVSVQAGMPQGAQAAPQQQSRGSAAALLAAALAAAARLELRLGQQARGIAAALFVAAVAAVGAPGRFRRLGGLLGGCHQLGAQAFNHLPLRRQLLRVVWGQGAGPGRGWRLLAREQRTKLGRPTIPTTHQIATSLPQEPADHPPTSCSDVTSEAAAAATASRSAAAACAACSASRLWPSSSSAGGRWVGRR